MTIDTSREAIKARKVFAVHTAYSRHRIFGIGIQNRLAVIFSALSEREAVEDAKTHGNRNGELNGWHFDNSIVLEVEDNRIPALLDRAEKAEAERDALKAERERLREAFRINALRWKPDLSHEEIDSELDRIALGDA